MMRKTLLAVALSVLSVAASAQPSPSNGFQDVYTVVNGTVLSGSVVSGPIGYQQLSPSVFLLTEPTGTLTGGIAQVSLGQDASHQCTLTIQDVDFTVPVLVAQTCTGNWGVASFNASYNSTTITLAHP